MRQRSASVGSPASSSRCAERADRRGREQRQPAARVERGHRGGRIVGHEAPARGLDGVGRRAPDRDRGTLQVGLGEHQPDMAAQAVQLEPVPARTAEQLRTLASSSLVICHIGWSGPPAASLASSARVSASCRPVTEPASSQRRR